MQTDLPIQSPSQNPGKTADALPAHVPSPFAIHRILTPVDFSEFSLNALEYAAEFALFAGAEVMLLHVVPLNYVDSDTVPLDFSEFVHESTATCEARLQRLRESLIPFTIKATVRVSVGRPAEEIVSCAKDHEADLIIMPTHGYTGLKHAFLGSTAENVVRHASCPVLTIRQKGGAVGNSPADTRIAAPKNQEREISGL